MKYFKIITLILLSSTISFYSCKEDVKAPKQETKVINTPTISNTTPQNPASVIASKNTGKVWHYTCIKGCAGGGDATGNCKNCNSVLVHNAAFHAQANTIQSSSPFATPAATNTKTEPSQNLAGVWHYTCTKGCAGGAGAAGNCRTCNNPLSHNAAYHQ